MEARKKTTENPPAEADLNADNQETDNKQGYISQRQLQKFLNGIIR